MRTPEPWAPAVRGSLLPFPGCLLSWLLLHLSSSLQPLSISCTPPSLSSLPLCVSVSPTPQYHSLQFPLTNIDRPLGGFPSSPLATTTSSSLSPSGAINFLPAWSCVSPYSRARGSRMGESGQMDRTLGTPPHSLSSLVWLSHHLKTPLGYQELVSTFEGRGVCGSLPPI